ncbi:hypothetical protein [Blastococcus xanthinilyticus]|uniref:hypothetical protein n=1 Tax=Blastococcus xanthinilyticus TaxID=1564164 RepID=UPI001412E030|nr:hypothetical protein [Blastococcus xanthinilyticus]
MGRTQRACVFCDETPLTREHVIPQWLRDVPSIAHDLSVEARGERRSHYIYSFEREPTSRVPSSTVEERGQFVAPRDLLVRVVCERCNTGWMSRREVGVQPLLTALIEGSSLTVLADGLVRLAAWTAKTAMMFEYNHPPTAGFSAAQHRDLVRRERPPRSTDVYLARFDGPPEVWPLHRGGPIGLLPPTGGSAQVIGRCQLTTLVLGEVALLVRSVTPAELAPVLFQKLGVPAPSWLRIWPSPPPRLQWPLTSNVVDEQDIYRVGPSSW